MGFKPYIVDEDAWTQVVRVSSVSVRMWTLDLIGQGYIVGCTQIFETIVIVLSWVLLAQITRLAYKLDREELRVAWCSVIYDKTT